MNIWFQRRRPEQNTQPMVADMLIYLVGFTKNAHLACGPGAIKTTGVPWNFLYEFMETKTPKASQGNLFELYHKNVG